MQDDDGGVQGTRAKLESSAYVVCEGSVMDMPKCAKQSPQTGTVALSDEHCAHLEVMLRYAAPEKDANGLGPAGSEFLAAGFLPAFEVARSIVLCRVVLVSKLNAAVEKLEQGEELGAGADSSSGGTLVQYVLGKGRP